MIQYTGGTTGTPKGAMLTHQNLSANARQVAQLDPEMGKTQDTILGVLPFFHVFANTCVLNRTVLTGGEIVMLPRFNAKQALAEIAPHPATLAPRRADHVSGAARRAGNEAATDFTSLRYCISGGAPLAAAAEGGVRERTTGARVIEGYGLSESSGVVSTNPYEGLNKPGTIGQPLAGHPRPPGRQGRPNTPAAAGRARRDRRLGAADHEGLLEPPRCRCRGLRR